jgi:hypothetical protein
MHPEHLYVKNQFHRASPGQSLVYRWDRFCLRRHRWNKISYHRTIGVE